MVNSNLSSHSDDFQWVGETRRNSIFTNNTWGKQKFIYLSIYCDTGKNQNSQIFSLILLGASAGASVHLLSASLQKLVISVSQRQGVNESANLQQNNNFGNAEKQESPPGEKPVFCDLIL